MKAIGNFPHQQSVNFNSEWQSKQAVKFLEFFYKKKNRNLNFHFISIPPKELATRNSWQCSYNKLNEKAMTEMKITKKKMEEDLNLLILIYRDKFIQKQFAINIISKIGGR